MEFVIHVFLLREHRDGQMYGFKSRVVYGLSLFSAIALFMSMIGYYGQSASNVDFCWRVRRRNTRLNPGEKKRRKRKSSPFINL